MRAGVSLFFESPYDWDRFEAAERGDATEGRPVVDDVSIYQEQIRYGHLIEELGFDAIWVPEHHVTPYTMVPNPFQMLTYFAGALDKVDLGTMVAVLPWHNPLRVVEEIVVLDNLLTGTGRKPIIGLGRGVGKREYDAMSIPMGESRPRFNESVEIIKLALTEDRFSFHGEIFNFDNVELRPKPRDPQRLLESLYASSFSPESVPIVAGYGLKPLLIPVKPWEEYHVELNQLATLRAEAGYAPARPIMTMWIYCAETEEAAREGAHQWLPDYADSCMRHYQYGGTQFKGVKGYEYYAQQADPLRDDPDLFARIFLDHHIWGTPEQCLAKLQAVADAFHPEELILVSQFGGMPMADAEKSLRLFAREVLPAVHEIPAQDALVPTAR